MLHELREKALPMVPVADRSIVEEQYQSLAESWGCQGLKSGDLEEILEILSRNLELFSENAYLFSENAYFQCFRVDTLFRADPSLSYPLSTSCWVRVVLSFEKPTVYIGLFGGIRRGRNLYGMPFQIWRGPECYYLCGPRRAILD